jgi:hypothetical protein
MEPLRYVILHHTGVADPHFDLMFETVPGGALATFRCPIWPIAEAAAITPLGDHRREYLEHEGPVSGGRGEVRRVAGGTYRTVSRTDERWQIVLDESVSLTVRRSSRDGSRWRVERNIEGA